MCFVKFTILRFFSHSKFGDFISGIFRVYVYTFPCDNKGKEEHSVLSGWNNGREFSDQWPRDTVVTKPIGRWDKDEGVEKEVKREDGGVLRGKRITETVAYARIQRVGVRGNTVAMRAWLHIAITSVPRAGGHKAFCRTMAYGQEARSVTPACSMCEWHPHYTSSNMYTNGETEKDREKERDAGSERVNDM